MASKAEGKSLLAVMVEACQTARDCSLTDEEVGAYCEAMLARWKAEAVRGQRLEELDDEAREAEARYEAVLNKRK